eukprot:Hpha_TRINITY_DN11364_c0_g1::TRINITY_DN11364_c0_g1_i1::g.63049::m.63049
MALPMVALPEVNEQIREYAAEVRAKTRVDDIRREFNVNLTASYGLRCQAEYGTDIEASVDTVLHLLHCVQRSFNTFRLRCRLWFRRVKTVARMLKQWHGVRQRRMATLYSAWMDWEQQQVNLTRQQHPHRPTGEVRRLIEENLVLPSPGQKHKCILALYAARRRLFHAQFGDWHAKRQGLQRQVRALKKQAVAEKAEQAQADLAREELAAMPLGSLTGTPQRPTPWPESTGTFG